MQVLWNGTMRCAPALSMYVSLTAWLEITHACLCITEIKNTKGRGVTSNADSATVYIIRNEITMFNHAKCRKFL